MKNKKILIILCTIVILGIIIAIFVINRLNDNNMKGTIGYIAYDYNKKGDYRVYIKENGKYEPYLVLVNNYTNVGNTLLLRENIIGGEDEYIIYDIFTPENVMYSGQLTMQQFTNYDETYVDKYLTDEFYKRFDEELLEKIINTEIEITNNENPEEDNYKIKRKFFLLSVTELGLSNIWDNYSKYNNPIGYFNSSTRIAQNEAKTDVVWWSRSYCWSSFCAIDQSGWLLTESSTDVVYGVRPAFSIPSTTKITSEYNNELSKNINVLY